MSIFSITHKSTDGKSRNGILQLPHGTVQTPVFMPVGTCATVKAMSIDELNKMLQIAVENEQYEEASRIKKEIDNKSE